MSGEKQMDIKEATAKFLELEAPRQLVRDGAGDQAYCDDYRVAIKAEVAFHIGVACELKKEGKGTPWTVVLPWVAVKYPYPLAKNQWDKHSYKGVDMPSQEAWIAWDCMFTDEQYEHQLSKKSNCSPSVFQYAQFKRSVEVLGWSVASCEKDRTYTLSLQQPIPPWQEPRLAGSTRPAPDSTRASPPVSKRVRGIAPEIN